MKTFFLVAIIGLLPLVILHPIESDDSLAVAVPKKESLDALSYNGGLNYDGTIREKRTIGPLRQIFPNLSQLVDRKIQMITRVLFRVIGRLVLRGGLGGGGGGGGAAAGGSSNSSGGTNSRRISITLPTYPPGEDDDEDEDEDDEEVNTAQASDASSDTVITTEGDSKNQLDGAESQVNEVRVQYVDQSATGDQETAASEDNEQAEAQDDAAAVEDDDAAATDEQRNKRFLPFNLGGGGGGSSAGGSGGGSGNFLFDIIRLVAGSGNTEASDEKANSAVGVATAAEQTVEKDDGYQAGVPGPITRLFIIANRGIANLMQDLILRLAQTSERIVNFKARLITSII